MKRFSEKFITKIEKAQKAGKIKKFRVSFKERKNASSGATQKEFMGKYKPLNLETKLSGTYLFQWKDGKLSKGNIRRQSILEFDRFLDEARQTAFKDEFGDNFPRQKKHPQIKTGFQSVIKLEKNPAPYLTKWLEKLKKWQESSNPNGTQHMSAHIGISQYRMVSSAGFDLSTQATSCHVSSYYDSKAYLSHSSRKLPEPEEVKAKKDRAETILSYLQKSVQKKPPNGTWNVIYQPSIFRSLFFSFLVSNLRGSSVINGQSKFSLEDFKKQEKVFRKDISIICNPTKDGGLDSYNFTAEGVRSKKTTFIKNGRLITPILSVKYARKGKMEPTAQIHHPMDTTTIENNKNKDFDKFLKKQNRTLLIYKALGGHAQDRTTGSYSLPCPYAILIDKGEFVGNIPCVVTGNFFNNLNNPETTFLKHPTKHPPALATTANVMFT